MAKKMMISRHGSHWKALPYSFMGSSQLGHRGVIALTSARLVRETNRLFQAISSDRVGRNPCSAAYARPFPSRA
jgi:hypothetical protein